MTFLSTDNKPNEYALGLGAGVKWVGRSLHEEAAGQVRGFG